MPGNLRSLASKLARKKKRGESEEAYAKRIARLEQKRASAARVRQASLAEPEAKPEVKALDSNLNLVAEPPPPVVERILSAHNDDLKRAESQILLLVKQLENERKERLRIQRDLETTMSVLSARNHSTTKPRFEEAQNQEQGVEIIDLSSTDGQFDAPLEIIEVFDEFGQGPETVSAIADKSLILFDLSEPLRHPEGDPASPPSSPLKGVSIGRGRATHPAPTGGFSDGGPEQISLAEASEMLLLLGWVDRARREFPHQPLRVRFGEHESRVWRDVVAATAEFVGCDDVGVPSEEIPFAFELAWTLRYALDSLPACAPLLDVCWRYMAGFMKPQPRAALGILAGSEKTEAVKKKFQIVEKEIATGLLVVDRSAA